MRYSILLTLSVFWGAGCCGRVNPVEILEDAFVNFFDTMQDGQGDNEISGLKCLYPNCPLPPVKCPNKNIGFWYYESYGAKPPVLVDPSSIDSLTKIPKNDFPWKVIFHNFGESRHTEAYTEMINAYRKRGNYNIIIVDYSPFVKHGCDAILSYNLPLISKCTAQFFDALVQFGLLRMNNVHIIAVGLGVEFAANVHEYMTEINKPYRITGLNPIPLKMDATYFQFISPRSANFVDIIVSKVERPWGLKQIGHADFHINGGIHGRDCPASDIGSCTFNRAIQYYTKSINSVGDFWAVPCDNYGKYLSGDCDSDEVFYGRVGEDADITNLGRFYLTTNTELLGAQVRIAEIKPGREPRRCYPPNCNKHIVYNTNNININNSNM